MSIKDQAPAKPGVSYRVLPKGAGNIYTGEHDVESATFLTFAKGDVVEGVAPDIAAALEDRGWVEILGAKAVG